MGEVDQIRLNATMTQNVVTYTVVVTTDNSSGRLLPYLTASLRFEIARRHGVLLVPTSALRWWPQPQRIAPDIREAHLKEEQRREAEGGPTPTTENAKKEHEHGQIWVLDQGFVRPVEVGIGLSDGIQTEITSGELAEGQAVVVGEAQAAEEGTISPFAPRLFSGGQK
jgi:HlyD family secretion protein